MGGEKLFPPNTTVAPPGSPPRGRGKGGVKLRVVNFGRITPAWAGKRWCPLPGAAAGRDHPRVGGEKQAPRCRTRRWTGSPPRGRGKGPKCHQRQRKPGITPAWAGKRRISLYRALSPRDHPRVGGEKTPPSQPEHTGEGSPPRGRGKVYWHNRPPVGAGITPAWAGKSDGLGWHSCCPGDHPRVGGEKFLGFTTLRFGLGSPPRGRGKAGEKVEGPKVTGITPAWAGKSILGLDLVGGLWDHPRVGGEKKSQTKKKVKRQGSPPRGRGKAFPILRVCVLSRITPAWAGKRSGWPTAQRGPRDHPRVGGKKMIWLLSMQPLSGSPPRGRGKANRVLGLPAHRGITPAWAGKSKTLPIGQSS